MPIDLEHVRKHTPASRHLIHFNNAGAALTPDPVLEAIFQHLQLEQRVGAYEAADQAAAALQNFYHAFATLLNCKSEEIAYAENATHAWNSLFHGIPFQPGDRIVTGQSEYASNYLALLHLAQQKQLKISVINNDENGQIDLEHLSAALDQDVKLIALTHIASQSGVIQPAAEVGALANKHNILYLLDACQSAGQLHLNVDHLGCDMLTGTGRKYLRGPRGTGFLYLRRSSMKRLQPAWIDLHSAQWHGENSFVFRDDARQYENWECFVAGKIGLGYAADYASNIGLHLIEQRIRMLASRLRTTLSDISGVEIHEQGKELSGIVTFSKEGEAAMNLHRRLVSAGINSSVCKLSNNLLDFSRRELGDINRASVHYYNTEQEIEDFCRAVSRTN
jgi:cysteine desulfurase/selenocysteine lyase